MRESRGRHPTPTSACPSHPFPPHIVQTYEAETFSPLVLCDFCPRAFHMSCLAPDPKPPPPPPETTAEAEEGAVVIPKAEEEGSAPKIEAGEGSGPDVKSEEVVAAGTAPSTTPTDPGAATALVADSAPPVTEKKEEEVAVPGGALGEAPVEDASEPPHAPATAPLFGFSDLGKGLCWACPKCEERHKMKIQG